jgi:predicted PurR-regulated permease PerM
VTSTTSTGGPPPRVHPTVDRLAAYSWRLIAIAVVGLGLLYLVARLRLVVLPAIFALLLARILSPIAAWLRRHRWRPGLAAAAALFGFLGALGLLGWVIASPVADQFADLEPTLSEAVDDVERWLVEDSPFDVSRADLERYREEIGDAVGEATRANSGRLVSGAIVAVEVVAGVILSFFITFFFVKDGARFRDLAIDRLPAARRDLGRRICASTWDTIGGYLRGAATLGIVESVVIGLTLTIVGASLAIPVMILTFLAAFVPIVGAIFAGVVAVLVALATAGPGAAVVVAIVAIVVQQLDNDLLAPFVYGRALALHPLVVLIAVAGGGALFGITGTLLAVPVTAVVWSMAREARRTPAAEPAVEPAAG